MQVCEIGATHGGGANFLPTTVNFAENGTFWLSVKQKRLFFYLKTLYFTDMPHPWKNQSICLLIQWRVLIFFKGDNSGTVNKI